MMSMMLFTTALYSCRDTEAKDDASEVNDDMTQEEALIQDMKDEGATMEVKSDDDETKIKMETENKELKIKTEEGESKVKIKTEDDDA